MNQPDMPEIIRHFIGKEWCALTMDARVFNIIAPQRRELILGQLAQDARMNPARETILELRRAEVHHGTAEPRDVEGLSRGRQSDGPLRDLRRQAREGDVLPPVEEKIRVDLVGDGEGGFVVSWLEGADRLAEVRLRRVQKGECPEYHFPGHPCSQ